MNSIKDSVEALDIDDEDEDAPIPGTVFNKRQARILKYVVFFLGFLLIAGFALLIGIIAYRASQPAKPTAPIAPVGVSVPNAAMPTPPIAPQSAIATVPGTPREIEGIIPKGAQYLSSTINGNRLVVTLQTPGKDLQIILIDLASWQITGTALLKQQQ